MVDARTKAALLWGVVGALGFLVLAQGYLLVSGQRVSYPPLLGVAVAVFAASAVTAHVAADRVA